MPNTRNPTLPGGVKRYGRGASYHRKGLWAVKAKKTTEKKTKEAKAVVKEFQGGKRTIEAKAPRHYPTVDLPSKLKRNFTPSGTRLRSSIKPGTVLILLAGNHRGKRVVCLRQLPSGLLLVTGPYKVNGVPLRRVSQAYVIATSTSVDVSALKLDERFNDAYFAKPAAAKKAKSEAEFFAADKEAAAKREVSAERKQHQKEVDDQLLAQINKDKVLRKYLGAKFSLKRGEYPHALKF